MKKFLTILLAVCLVAFGQTLPSSKQKSKLVISVAGDLKMDLADELMNVISHGLKNNDKYEILSNYGQFRETLKREWNNGNISDDRIIALAKSEKADYLCLAKITSVKGLKGKNVRVNIHNLNTNTETGDSGLISIDDDFSNLPHLTKTILNVVANMLGDYTPPPPKTTKITISYAGDPYSCLLPINITISGQTFMPQGFMFFVDNIPLGQHPYTIQGTITCAYIGTCIASGSGTINVQPDKASFTLGWTNNGPGSCNVWLN